MEQKTRPTMMDVGARAGVSQATVSLILNGSPGAKFSATTVRKVLKAAEELGYQLARRPDHSAGSVQRMVLFLTDENATDPWMPLAFEGIRHKAAERGFAALMTVGDIGEFSRFAQNPTEGEIAGLIYGTVLTRKLPLAEPMPQQPLVLLNCYDEERQIASVLPGDVTGGRQATERLILGGRRRIAIINGQTGLDATRDRLRGYRQALSSHDLDFDADLVRPGNWEPSSGYEQTNVLMSLPHPPDAIFCANDMIALGCYDALRERSLRVPDDVAVIGFDNREIARYMRPPLTTFELPQYEMGSIAAELLLDRISGVGEGREQIKVECPLITRTSC